MRSLAARVRALGVMASRGGFELLEPTALPRTSSVNRIAPSTPGRLQPQPPQQEQRLLEQPLLGQQQPQQKANLTWPPRGLRAMLPLLLLLLLGLGLPQWQQISNPRQLAVRLSEPSQGGLGQSASTNNAPAAASGVGPMRPCVPSGYNTSRSDLASAPDVAGGAARDGLQLPAPLARSIGMQGQPSGGNSPPVVLPASPDACAQALQIPKVALLFVTQGELHHEQTWRLWFKSAAGALPASSTLSSACSPEANTTGLPPACDVTGDNGDEISQQHLFSVYVHAPCNFTLQGVRDNVTEYPEGSLWRGRLVEHRVHGLGDGIASLEVARSLLQDAFQDPLNQRFLLLSAIDIPLYDPLTLYTQIMNETKSRVESCRQNDVKLERWSESLLPDVDQCQWRRSNKWFMLLREHAAVVLHDTPVFDRFKDWCFELSSKGSICVAHEHYIPTLLAGVHNLTHQLMCYSNPITSVAGEYKVGDATLHSFKRLRSINVCNATTAQASAKPSFVSAYAFVNEEDRAQLCMERASKKQPAYQPLSDQCSLLSQKWPQGTSQQIYRLFTDCGSGLRLLSADVCHGAGPFKALPRKSKPVTAILPPPEVAPASNDTCAQALQIPKVALLFLTKGPVFHEPTWRLWFKSAAGVVPAASMLNGVCSEASKFEMLSTACSVPSSAQADEISQQHLFSVYVHAPPSFNLSGMPNTTEYPLGSLWHGRLVQHRVYASWGGMSLVEATRHLMWEAFRDPLNSRFLLLSESDIPLYDPLTFYSQLMAESRSRVEGCPGEKSMNSKKRWADEMELPNLRYSHWRKSSQWVMLLRNHTSLVLEDTEVFRKFEEWCFPELHPTSKQWRDCYADEHYIPTLLGGVHGLEHQMHCQSSNTATAIDWSGSKDGHPRDYTPADVSHPLITKVRSMLEPCDVEPAQKSAQSQFVSISEALKPHSRSSTCAQALDLPLYEPLSAQCHLLARKFPQTTSPAVYNLTTTCDSGLALLSSDVCSSAQKNFSLPPNLPTASLPALDVLPESRDACSQALQLPRVALLFITQGELHHEKTWRLWFKSAAGVLPAAAVLKAVCGQKSTEQQQLLEACIVAGSGNVLSQQHLFSVYVHAPLSFDLPNAHNATDYPEGSLWKGQLVGHRVDASQGTMGFVEAARSLLWEAYRDPLNTRFLLLSESDIPLYDPLTLYTQLMAETTSRVESCWVNSSTPGQLPVEIREEGSLDEGTDSSKAKGSNWWHTIRQWLGLRPSPLEVVLDESTWRKGSPWFALQRSHAKLVLEDSAVFRRFERWCREGWDQYKQEYRDCRPDEHYLATLLGAVHQLQEELLSCEELQSTAGAADLIDHQHSNGTEGQPRVYEPAEVTVELIASACSFLVPCNGTRAQEEAHRQFTTVEQALGESTRDATCAALSAGRTALAYTLLPDRCRLTAGSFPKRSADALYRLFMQHCGSGLGLLGEGVCQGAAHKLEGVAADTAAAA